RGSRGRGAAHLAAAGHRPHWPNLELLCVPHHGQTEAIAMEVRRALLGEAHQEGPLLDLETLCALGPIRYREKKLRASERGLEGLLIPADDGQFDVIVDPEPPGG